MTTYEELRAAAIAATPQDLDTSQYITSDELYECPLCGGDGSVEGRDFCNFDDFAIGVHIYGIGEKMVACEQYPRKIISLLNELDIKDARIANLEDFLRRDGYRQCDIAECNCGSWHGGHASDNLSEISEFLHSEGAWKGTILESVKSLHLRAEKAEARGREVGLRKALDALNEAPPTKSTNVDHVLGYASAFSVATKAVNSLLGEKE